MKDYMDYTAAQRAIIDRYYEATKDCPQDRMPLEKLIGMKRKFPKPKPDKWVISKGEEELLTDGVVEIKKAGRKKAVIDNSYVVSWLSSYNEYQLAANDFYWLDDILVSMSRTALEGADRNLSIYLLFDFLSTAKRIDTAFIEEVCEVQPRQAQKIMAALKVANRAIDAEFRRMDAAGLQHERQFLYLT